MVASTGTRASDREEEQDAHGLHLPDLLIRGFRGIDELAIPRLGRVTLLAGKNGAGKTTVLEAVRVYAARGSYAALSGLLRDREEVFATTDEDGDHVTEIDWEALFYGRTISERTSIAIGPQKEPAERLRIDQTVLEQQQVSRLRRVLRGPLLDAHVSALQITFRDKKQLMPYIVARNETGLGSFTRRDIGTMRRNIRYLLQDDEQWPIVDCESLGPGLLDNDAMSKYWDKVALTEDENRSVRALSLVGADVDGVRMVGISERSQWASGRRAIVKLAGQDDPVPLRSLGDGARRIFGVALALANSRDGFLLIDEAENGIHHSVQRDFWRMILGSAQANNVQVLATTHSWDCVRSFAQAATALDAEGMLVRIERDEGDKVRAVEYPEEGLGIVAEQGIEVR